MLFVSCGPSSISPSAALPALIDEAAKKAPAVKSWPLPERLTKVRVTGRPAARWIGWGEKPKLQTRTVWPGGADPETAGADVARARDKAAAAAMRDRVMNTSWFAGWWPTGSC